MLLSLFVTASVLFHAKPATHHSATKPSAHLKANAVTALKGNVQFMMVVPSASAPPASPELLPLRPTILQDTPAQEERDEQALILAVNGERTERGLGALTADPLLTETALAHSREMCDRDYFDHLSPTPSLATPMDRYLGALRAWGENQPESATVGENIFYCSVTSDLYGVSYAHQCLMSSPGHRANILDTRFAKIGVGVYRDDQGRFWVTEMFLGNAQAADAGN